VTSDISWFVSMDRSLFEFFNKTMTSRFFDIIMPVISDLLLWVIPAAIIWLIFIFRTNRRGKLIALCCFLVVAATDQLSSSLIKQYVQRVRPCNVIPQTHYYADDHWITTDKFGMTTYKTSYSFPSSHAANIGGQAVYWSYFYPQISPALIVVALAVGYSRVYLGYHYPSDVFAGFLLGIIVALLIAHLLRAWVLPEE
jgi:undecaprenyl-diphosphatase